MLGHTYISLRKIQRSSAEVKALRSAEILYPTEFHHRLSQPITASTLYIVPTLPGFMAIQDSPVEAGKLCPSLIVTTNLKFLAKNTNTFQDYRSIIERQTIQAFISKHSLPRLLAKQQGILRICSKLAVTSDVITALCWQTNKAPIQRICTSLATHLSKQVIAPTFDPFHL